MSSIDNATLLDGVTLYYKNKFPEDEQTQAQALDAAEAILYGDDANPELSTDGNTVTLDDYQDYGDFICDGEIETDVVDDEFFDDVLLVIDDLIVESLGLDDQHINLWGECPTLESDATEVSVPTNFLVPKTTNTATKKPETKPKASNTPAKPATPSTQAVTALPATNENQVTVANFELAASPLGVCSDLASRIAAGGGYMLYVDKGFACEFNYKPGSWSSLLLINELGVKVSPIIFSYYVDSVAIAATNQNATSRDLPPAEPSAPTTFPAPTTPQLSPLSIKPKNLSDAVRAYKGPPVDEETGDVIE